MTLAQIKQALSRFGFVIKGREPLYEVSGCSMTGVDGWLFRSHSRAELETLCAAAERYEHPGGYVAPQVRQRAILKLAREMRQPEVAA